MNGKYYDKETETFVDNPFIKQLVNEKKIKLFFRDEWYDLIIKKVEENKRNYAYTYTANDLYINELGKNGFKVELDTELENNQGTAAELAAQVLEDTDWKVSQYTDDAEYKSDLIVENNLDTLYKAYLCKDILVKVSADGWLPIREEDVEPAFVPGVDDKTTQIIKKGEQIYLFYSDLIAKNTEPMVLYRAYRSYDNMGNVSSEAISEKKGGIPVYQMNDNEDIIINSYNFRVTRENNVTYNDDEIPLPDFIVYDEYMTQDLSISDNRKEYFYTIEKDGTIKFVEDMPDDYRGNIYYKQDTITDDEGNIIKKYYGITLEDKCRAYETIRRAETGYDPVTDEFVTYFLKRLYTKEYVKTEDTIPYSNKAYFTRVEANEDEVGDNIADGYKYIRFYGYTFGAENYYELKYDEFLRDGEPLDDNTTYYVKSQVPEYVPTIDTDVNYYQAFRYKNGVQYFYFNEIIRQYVEVHFNDEEEFNSFGKNIYYREDKKYYLYDTSTNEYKEYGNFDVYMPTKQIFNLGTTDTNMRKTSDSEPQEGKIYYTKSDENIYITYTGSSFDSNVDYYEEYEIQTWAKLPTNLAYYIEDYVRYEVEPGHIFDTNSNVYSILDIYSLTHNTDITLPSNGTAYAVGEDDFKLVPKNSVYDKYTDYYILAEDDTYQKQQISGFVLDTDYYVKTSPTYYYYPLKVEDKNGDLVDNKKIFQLVEYPEFIGDEVYTEKKYYLHSLSTCLPLYNKLFVYEQSGKMIDGYIKYEDSVWSRLKGYTDTEYLSPTLVQNFLANSTEISTLNSGWLFDGAPSSSDRAGELTNRLDDPTLPDPDEDPTSSLLILHLTDTPVYYASQTGEYLYTSYDFVVSNPMISNNEFWDEITPFFEKEEVNFNTGDFYPTYEYEEITDAAKVKEEYRNRTVYRVEAEDDYYKVTIGAGNDFIEASDNEDKVDWIDSSYAYYIKKGLEYDFYCTKLDTGLYQSIDKIYFKKKGTDEDGNPYLPQQILHYKDYDINQGSYWIYSNGEFKDLGYEEANRYIKDSVYFKKDGNSYEEVGTFANKWDFFAYDEQLYFKHYINEEEFYAIVGYTAETPIYGFKHTEDEYLIQNKAYYKLRTDLSEINSTSNMFFESTNNFEFEGGVNQYFTYDADKDKYEKVSYGAEPKEGVVYYEFKPTGKMQYLPYDYYKDAWESAAIRDYLDNVFPSPGYEAYVPFDAVPTSAAVTGNTYWAKRTDGTYQELDDYALRNYQGDYVYEQWEEDAIAELQAIFNFEYTEDELTEYASDLLDLVSELLDWADYEQESRIEILNAIDLFGIKRAIMLQKLRRLEKNYPDVEGYQREELLKYLGLLNDELNQELRMEMSVIADPQVVNYIPTQDSERKGGKKYYYFEQPSHANGQVSRSFMAKEYEGEVFYKTYIDGVEYRIRPDGTQDNSTSLASLIIYEFTGELPDMLEVIGDGIDAISDSNKQTTLEEVKAGLEEIRFESSWSYLNPLKVYKAYNALIQIREWLKSGKLGTYDPNDETNTKIYQTILAFYQLFFEGNNDIDSAIWRGLGFISNDAIPFYVQSIFSRAEIEYSIQEVISVIDEWINNYHNGKITTYEVYYSYSGEELYNLVEDNKSVTVYIPTTNYTKTEVKDEITYYTSIDGYEEKIFTADNINEIINTDVYYVKEVISEGEVTRYKNLLYSLQEYAGNNVTYVKVDTKNETPNPNEKYYFKDLELEEADGQSVNSTKRYFQEVDGGYKEVTNEIAKHVTNTAINSDIWVFKRYRYIEITEEITSWDDYENIVGNTSNEYYRKQPGFIDYSKSVTYNTNLAKAIRNFEEVMALRFDDVNELKTGNKVFDDVTEAITGFTIIWHLEKEERQQVVEGTKLLINLSKQLTALQISDDFIDFCLDRRYEGHKRRALNTGFAANRTTIKKLNKGEEYVFALSLGRYYEGEEPPTYTKKGSFSYGDIENKYYYFDNIPTGIGDYAIGADEYKEIFYGEPNYDTPYGWMEAEGRFELATTDDTINPLFVCIGQEVAKDRFATRFVSPTSDEISRIFYYEEEGGDYICVRRPEGLFSTVKVYEKASDYKWFNGSLDQVLMNDGKWRVLFNSRKKDAKRFRRSPTYVCLKAQTGLEGAKDQTLGCVPCDKIVNSYVKLTNDELSAGPLSGTTYYVYDKNSKNYVEATLGESDAGPIFESGVIYFRLIRPSGVEHAASDIQYFRRSTDNLSEGKYKLDAVTSIGDINTDGDFYKILSVNERARGPEQGVIYYVYNDSQKMFQDAGEIAAFDEDIDYYYATYDRDHYSLYTSDDLLPDLYCFVPDNNGDYVHIIRKEEVEEVNVKWYQFWLREENINKIYREFKDTDELSTDAPHYFKRYNSAMDYDFHTTSWKDGHIGPWREYYQRYSKFRIHLYDNTELDESYTYWISTPFSDGSECYTLYTQEQPKRFTLHQRYLGYENGVHKYLTLDEAIAKADTESTGDTVHLNVNDITFSQPYNYKNYTSVYADGEEGEINYNSGGFIAKLGVHMVPVKIDTRMFRTFENETDSQRVPYIMLKSDDNLAPGAGTDWIYCQSQNASDAGYYRECTVDDTNAYTNWQISEGVDEVLGLYKFLKVKDPINWNSDEPPFTFATPMEVSMLSHEYAMNVIKLLNTPYWWGRTRYHTFASFTRQDDSFEKFINFLKEFWEWGDRVFISSIWRYITQSETSDDFVRGYEKAQDNMDEFLEGIAAIVRAVINFFDFSSDNHNAQKILNWIDNNGVDINSDDPDYLLVNYSTPIDGVNYYTKQKIDDKYVYVLWEGNGAEGKREFEDGVNYFILEAEQEAPQEWLFKDLDNNVIGLIKYAEGSPTITYHYFPNQKSSYFSPISYDEAYTKVNNGNEKICYVNAKNGSEGKIDLVVIDENYVRGGFIPVKSVNELSEGTQYYENIVYDPDNTEYETDENLTYDARLQFWDSMYGLYGTQWSNIIERETFGLGGTAFLNTEDEFTEEVLEEIYAFSELWVKETHNGFTKFIPFDSILHSAKPKYYRHTYSGELKDAVDGITEIYYNDGGTYKYYATKDNYDTVIPVNYDGLKVSFCEYDYEASNFRISPIQTDDSFEANLDYSNHHKVYLDFDCSNPIEGYFDLTIASEVEGLEGEEPITPAIKERYIWWKAPVQHNYNLTDDLYSRVGTLFYTDSKSLKSYPIVSAQLFKYKTYKSYNYDVLADFKKQFYEYETFHKDTYEPTFEEYKTLKEAFQGYFGIDEWNKVENLMDLDYKGDQNNWDIYNSYLEMLSFYLNENGDRTTFLKDRIIYNPATGQYSFRFKNRKPIESNRKVSADMVKIKLSYYADAETDNGRPDWENAKIEKTVVCSGDKGDYLNAYEWQEANSDLQIPIANFDNVDLNRFNTLIKNLMYKYSMYKVSNEERGDVNDIYYTVKEVYANEEATEPYYEIESHDGFSKLPNETVYHARALKQMEIQNPTYKYEVLTKGEFDLSGVLESGSDLYYFGYNAINNPDSMFILKPIPSGGTYDKETTYYKKVNGLWVKAYELTEDPGYQETDDAAPVFGKVYFTKNEVQDEYTLFTGDEFEVGVTYYVGYGPLGNISYYTWDSSLIYYRENCSWVKVVDDVYNYEIAYYMHEDMPNDADSDDFHQKALLYGELYSNNDVYEILEDINEEIFKNWDGTLYQRVTTPGEISYQQGVDAYAKDPNSLYIKYWYPLTDIKSEEQFAKYVNSNEAPNGIYKYDDKAPMYLRGGSTFYTYENGTYTPVDSSDKYITYDSNVAYYITEQHNPLTHKQMLDNYLIIEPYTKVEVFNTNDVYWTWTLVRPEKNEGYRNNIRYYQDIISYETVDNKTSLYESDAIYCKETDIDKFYTREITIEAKINGSSTGGVKANLKVTYQIIDGLDGIWPFDPEVYEDITLWPNPNEGYLARRIEELAYLHRKESNLWERIIDPNPFKYFVCDGIYSELIGINAIEEGKTYEVTVTLDTRLLAGHHDISEDYDPSELNWLSSLNDVASTWWDQQMARQEAHYKKANQSVNDFWSSLFAWVKGERPIEDSPETSGSTNNGKASTSSSNNTTNLPDDTQDNVVIMNGEERSPNIITLLLPNELEQKFKFDDVLEQLDADIEDFVEEGIDKIQEGIKTIDKVVTENTQKFVEELKETRTEIKQYVEDGQEKTKEVVTKIVDYVEDTSDSLATKAKEAISNSVNTASKVVTGIVDVGKSAANQIGKLFSRRWSYSLEDEVATTLMSVVNSDQAVNNSLSEKLTAELQKSLILSNTSATGSDSSGVAVYMAQLSDYLYEVAQFVTYIQQLGYYDFMRDYKYLSNIEDFYSTFEEKYSNPEFLNRLMAGIYHEAVTNKYIMALPGEIPDNNDLILTNYYLYDPTLPDQDDEDTLVYDYVGNDALDYYIYDYDDLCQKVRSVEVKEKNYLSILQAINEKFECWSKYELSHYTEEENKQLSVMDFVNAHTPGEVKMYERAVWVAEDDETDIFFDPINISNSHISNKQNEVVSALSQFNPKDYWEARKDYVEWNGHVFEDGVTYYYETPTGAFKEVNRIEVQIPDGQETYYTKIDNGNEEAVANSEKAEDKTYFKNIMMVPLKTIYFKQFTGDLNYAGFKYGINLNSIKRTLDSKELVSRLIVKENTNEHAMDGFCTIQRAAENPIKESFILNFDYYVQHLMLDRAELWQDLYGLESGYYSKLASINKDLDDLVNEIAEINECLDGINANYETYSLARDAAQQEIEEMAITLAECMPDGVPSPWKYNMAKEIEVLRTSWSDTQTKQFTTTDEDGNVIEMTEHVVQGQTRAIEVPKYSEDTQKKIKQMDIFQRNYEKYRGWALKAKEQKELYESKLEELYEKSDNMYRMKNNLNLMFFKKYYRFIQEGSWKEDDYMDDTLYYLDALATARTSAFPKATYDIQTIDLENLEDYKAYKFRIGDKTYIEDTEFFGYTQSGKPYQEETIITKLEYMLDNPAKNKITVTNYKTQFEDIFKRIAATVSKVELGTGAYNRANASINETGLGSSSIGQTAAVKTLETINGSVAIGAEGLVTTEVGVPSNKLKIVNGAVYRSTDGGTTYQKIITADGGIDPSLIGNGRLDLTSLTIGSKNNPELSFTANGMTAFRKFDDVVDYSTFVRFDSYGMYGINGYKRNSSTDDASDATLNDVFVPTDIDNIYENASYGLTWDGFFLKTGDGAGRVTIGTNQDLRMSTKNSSDAWQDRIVIGKLQDGEENAYYGFRIIDNNDNVVLNTNDKGQLYLRHKLYISHFNDEYGTTSNEQVTIDKPLDQTNVALGIVKAYKRKVDGGYEAGEEIHDNYSSLDYLTKILSVKSAVDGYDLKGELKSQKDYFKQFTQADINTLIDSNENLAIFDNGNLYAKNAWIEGNIRATSGTFTGTLTAAKLEAITFSKENTVAIGGSIFVRPTATIIDFLGYNLDTRILTVITDINDKDDTDFLPGIICEIPLNLSNETFIIIEKYFIDDKESEYYNNKVLKLQRIMFNTEITSDMVKNKPLINYGGVNYQLEDCEIGTFSKDQIIYKSIRIKKNMLSNKEIVNMGALRDKFLTIIQEEYQYNYSSNDIIQIIMKDEEIIIVLNEEETIFKEHTPISLLIEGGVSCISIVSSSSTINNQAVSLYKVNYPVLSGNELVAILEGKPNIDFLGSINYNSILGNFPKELELEETSGLYTENGIFYGKVLNRPQDGEKGVYSGLDSNSLTTPNVFERFEQLLSLSECQKIQEEVGNIVFWAGANDKGKDAIALAPFIVDSKGNMFSNNAYITNSILSNSTIRGSTLEVATIIGSGEEPALIIKDSKRGIVIVDENEKESFSINKNSLISELETLEFKIRENGRFLVSTNLSIGEEQKQYRAAYNKNKEQIGINLFIS